MTSVAKGAADWPVKELQDWPVKERQKGRVRDDGKGQEACGKKCGKIWKEVEENGKIFLPL